MNLKTQQDNNLIQQLINAFYERLLKQFGPQGWWPLLGVEGDNPTKTGSITGYHPNDYSYPKNKNQQFQILVGSILTQNTSWIQVEKALIELQNNHLLNPENLCKNTELTKRCIRVCGYFNQKTRYLESMCQFILTLDSSKNFWHPPARHELLKVKGIGPETADTMLCYAFSQTHFVVDAYTIRIFKALNWIENTVSYQTLQNLIESALPKNLICYQEFHALLVELAKRIKSADAEEHKLLSEFKLKDTN